jgi:hypothetical protein
MIKYSIQNHSFLTDGLMDFPHFSPIKKLVFISRSTSGISQIGALDELGVVSVWSIMEMQGHHITDYDLNMSLGGKLKMVMNYHDNLFEYENVINFMDLDNVIQSIEIEFDPEDTQIFFFATTEGLFKVDKKEKSQKPVKMDTMGLNSPTALSMSDKQKGKGYLLAAYSCGSIW